MASRYYQQKDFSFKSELEIVLQLGIQSRQENANTFEVRWKIYQKYTVRVQKYNIMILIFHSDDLSIDETKKRKSNFIQHI